MRTGVLTMVQAHILPDEGHGGDAQRALSQAGAVTSAPAATRRGAPAWRALMRRIGAMAAFLGVELASRTLVPALMWLPNEPDWRARSSFFRHLPQLSATVVRLLFAVALFRLHVIAWMINLLTAPITTCHVLRVTLAHSRTVQSTRLPWQVCSASHDVAKIMSLLQGPFTLTKVFLPVLDATLGKGDEQPAVLVQALTALTQQITSGQIPVHSVLVPAPAASPRALHLLLHQAAAVRRAAVLLFSSVARQLDAPDLHALLRPALAQQLRAPERPLNPLLYSDEAVVCAQIRCVDIALWLVHDLFLTVTIRTVRFCLLRNSLWELML